MEPMMNVPVVEQHPVDELTETTPAACCCPVHGPDSTTLPCGCNSAAVACADCQPVGVGRAIWQVLSAALLTMAVGIAVAVYLIPRMLGGDSLVINSGSMLPALAPGDIVAVRAIEPHQIAMGDIVTYSTQNALITHRVIGVGAQGNGATIITQGDANNAADAPILAEQVRGKVIYTLPMLGMVTGWLRGNIHWVIAGLGVVWLASYGKQWSSEKRCQQ